MKGLLFGGLIALLVGCATMSDSAGPVPDQYQKIIPVQKQKDALFNASMLWIAESFRSAKAVVQYSDKESGVISGLATATDNFGGIGSTTVEFKFLIEVKNNKARLTFSNYHNLYDNSTSGRLAASLDPKLTAHNWKYFAEWADNVFLNYEHFVAGANSNW